MSSKLVSYYVSYSYSVKIAYTLISDELQLVHSKTLVYVGIDKAVAVKMAINEVEENPNQCFISIAVDLCKEVLVRTPAMLQLTDQERDDSISLGVKKSTFAPRCD